jgi:hypothetical protein
MRQAMKRAHKCGIAAKPNTGTGINLTTLKTTALEMSNKYIQTVVWTGGAFLLCDIGYVSFRTGHI